MDKETKLMIIRIILFLIWALFLALMIFVSASSASTNPCSSCSLYIPIGFALKITTLKASDKSTLERWVKDFIDSHKVIKIDNSKFPESVTLYHIEKEK